MNIAWLTDIHLNFLSKAQRKQYFEKIRDTGCDAVLISGDIAEATDIYSMLEEMMKVINKPIYFVLGNHDYYKGTVSSVRHYTKSLCAKHELLNWLPLSDFVELNEQTALVGQDGWADARNGDFEKSTLSLADSKLIEDLKKVRFSKAKLKAEMQRLADQDATALAENLESAIQAQYSKIIITTHVPPYPGSCYYNGAPSDDNGLPYFSSQAIGNVISDFATRHPDVEFLVLTGHTHDKVEYKPHDNVLVKAGAAEYKKPIIQEMIDVDNLSLSRVNNRGLSA